MLKRLSLGVWLALFGFFMAVGCGEQPAQKAPTPSEDATNKNVSGKGNPTRPAPPAPPPIPAIK